MALSNKFGSLVLTTGNKSELAVGYCTLYGDMCGALAVIADLFKTEVYRIARWVNRDQEIIPQDSITKPPSAELRPNQKDQDSLPPYEVLDQILNAYVVQDLSRDEIVKRGFDPAVVSDVINKVTFSDTNGGRPRQVSKSPLAPSAWDDASLSPNVSAQGGESTSPRDPESYQIRAASSRRRTPQLCRSSTARRPARPMVRARSGSRRICFKRLAPSAMVRNVRTSFDLEHARKIRIVLSEVAAAVTRKFHVPKFEVAGQPALGIWRLV